MTKIEEEYESELRSLIASLSEKMKGTQIELHEIVLEEGIRADEQELASMLHQHIDRCPECNIWVDRRELFNEKLEIVPCESCRS